MKTFALLLFLCVLSTTSSFACVVCKTNQPKILQGITHGAGPDSNWDYLIVYVMVAVVIGTLALAIRHLVKPGESSAKHIKQIILNQNVYE